MLVLYVTCGIAPYVLGGMQVVSRRHICGLDQRGFDLAYIHTFRREQRVPPDLPGAEFVLDYPFSHGLRRYSPWHYPTELRMYSRGVEKIVRKLEPDVIYSEGPVVYETLRSRPRCPIVFHPHGLNMFQDQKSLVRNLRAKTLRPLFRYHAQNADRTISQGGKLTDILEKTIGVESRKIAFLPNSVPAAANAQPKRRGSGPLKCLFVGREDPNKGFDLLAAAMRKLHDVRLDVVGIDGRDSDRIRFHGVIRDVVRVQEFYRDADVLVLPSYSEGMATVLLEAMKVGMPAIATDVGATSEVVVNGRTGWLIQPGSIDDIVSAINAVMTLNDEDFSRFSANCIRHVQ